MSFIIDDSHEDIYQNVRAVLAEHFPNFCFIVMDDAGDFYYDYTNAPIGKMLIHEMKEDMEGGGLDDDWAVSYTHLTLPTTLPRCRSRWSPYH